MLYYCRIERKFISSENGTGDPIYHFTLQEVQNDGIPGTLVRVEGCQTNTLLEEALNVKTSHHEPRSSIITTTDNQQISDRPPMFAETYLGMLTIPHCMRISRTRYTNQIVRHENDGTLISKMSDHYQVNGNGRRLLMMQIALPLCQISTIFQRIHQLNLMNVYKHAMMYLNILHLMNLLRQTVLKYPMIIVELMKNKHHEKQKLLHCSEYDQLFIEKSKSIKNSPTEYFLKRIRGETFKHLQNRMVFTPNIFL